MGKAFVCMSAFYLVFGLTFGYVIGLADWFHLSTIHVHVNLVGWVTSAIFGIAYLMLGERNHARLIRVHFILHSVGAPMLIGGMYLIITGLYPAGIVISAIGGAQVIIGAILFAGYTVRVKPA